MKPYKFLNNFQEHKNGKPLLKRGSRVSSKAEIKGKVYVHENVTIGESKIIAENDHEIKIGKDSVIKDCVLIKAKDSSHDFHELEVKKPRDVIIGNKVFISSNVTVHGPGFVADRTFIGNSSTIVNSKIGPNCVIEDNVLIKNMAIPKDTFIPSKSVIDSCEKLNNLLSINNQGDHCDLSFVPQRTAINPAY